MGGSTVHSVQSSPIDYLVYSPLPSVQSSPIDYLVYSHHRKNSLMKPRL